MGALAVLDTRLLRLVVRLHTGSGRRALLAAAREMDLTSLLVLYGGFLTATVALTRAIKAALTAAPGPTFGLLGGLIAASAVVLFDTEWLTRPDTGLAGVAGVAVAFVAAGASGTGCSPSVY